GSYAANGAISATATVSGDVDRLVRFAHEQGWMKRDATTGCTYQLRAVATGTKDKIDVPNAAFELRGALRADATGRMTADRSFETSGTLDGALQPLLDLAAAWSGEEPRRLDGKLSAEFSAGGTTEKFGVRCPRLSIAAQGVKIDAS